MRKLNFGIVGCGAIADFHAKAIACSRGGALYGVTDSRAESAGRFAENYCAKRFESLDEMLADPAVDAVCVCTPSGSHAAVAIAALDAGKHVLIEKPLAITDNDCAAVIAAAKRSGKRAGVISQLRFAPDVITVKRLIDEGRLGTPVTAVLNMKYHRTQEYYDASDWRGKWATDGGSLMNQGIHGVDLMLYLMGGAKRVCGYAKTLAHDMEAEDTAVAAVEFESGALGIVESSTAISPGYPRMLTLCGTKGTVTITDESMTTCDLDDGYKPLSAATAGNGGHRDPLASSNTGHEKQVQDLIDAINEGRDTAVPLTEAAAAVRFINAVYRSERSGEKEEI